MSKFRALFKYMEVFRLSFKMQIVWHDTVAFRHAVGAWVFTGAWRCIGVYGLHPLVLEVWPTPLSERVELSSA